MRNYHFALLLFNIHKRCVKERSSIRMKNEAVVEEPNTSFTEIIDHLRYVLWFIESSVKVLLKIYRLRKSTEKLKCSAEKINFILWKGNRRNKEFKKDMKHIETKEQCLVNLIIACGWAKHPNQRANSLIGWKCSSSDLLSHRRYARGGL